MKRRIQVGLDEETYNQLEFVSRQQGKSMQDGARMAISFMLLFLQNTALRVYFNDRSAFDRKAAETFKELYGISIEEVAEAKRGQ